MEASTSIERSFDVVDSSNVIVKEERLEDSNSSFTGSGASFEPSTFGTQVDDRAPDPSELVCVKMEACSDDDGESEQDKSVYQPEMFEESSEKLKYLLTTSLKRTGSENYHCEIGAKAFTSKCLLDQHTAVAHENVKCFKCVICDRAFTRRKALTLHIDSVHLGIKPLKCLSHAKEKSKLESHISEDMKRFECEFCSRHFLCKDSLEIHINRFHSPYESVHLQEQTYVCNYCSKAFTHKRNLIEHIRRVHEKSKPFKCSYCDKTFSRKRYLLTHQEFVHEVDNRLEQLQKYTCDVCSKSFNDKSNMLKHMQAVHEKLRFTCQTCSMSYSRKDRLTKHQKYCTS